MRVQKNSGQVSKKARICVSTGKWWNPGEYRKKVESVPLLKNSLDECRKKVESVSISENVRIRGSTGKRRIRATTKKVSGEYRKRVESV